MVYGYYEYYYEYYYGYYEYYYQWSMNIVNRLFVARPIDWNYLYWDLNFCKCYTDIPIVGASD